MRLSHLRRAVRAEPRPAQPGPAVCQRLRRCRRGDPYQGRACAGCIPRRSPSAQRTGGCRFGHLRAAGLAGERQEGACAAVDAVRRLSVCRVNARPNPCLVDSAVQVLRFNAWFEEAVPNDPKVASRVRYFEILFYVVDGTIEVNESNVARYLKRTRVPKGAAPRPGEPVTTALGMEDLAVASDLTIYSQTFHLVSCDSFTRAFYAEQGVEQAADISAPQTARDTQNARASAAAARAHTQSAMQRGVQFLQNDGKVLRFTGLLFDPAVRQPNGYPCRLPARAHICASTVLPRLREGRGRSR